MFYFAYPDQKGPFHSARTRAAVQGDQPVLTRFGAHRLNQRLWGRPATICHRHESRSSNHSRNPFYHIPPEELERPRCVLSTYRPPAGPLANTLLFVVQDVDLPHSPLLRSFAPSRGPSLSINATSRCRIPLVLHFAPVATLVSLMSAHTTDVSWRATRELLDELVEGPSRTLDAIKSRLAAC